MRYLIPIASKDELFPREEFHFPKPLIEINNVPMIGLAIQSIINCDVEAEFIFVVNKADCVNFSLDRALELSTGRKNGLIQLDRPTKGALCSCLMAIELINDDRPIFIVNGDQVLDFDLTVALRYFEAKGAAAGVITFESVHPRWSYVRTDGSGNILEAAEKRVISRRAIAGVYYYQKGSAFVEAAGQVILDGASLNGIYYISSALNNFILSGDTVLFYDIATVDFHSFYSPQRVDYYQKIYAAKSEVRAEEMSRLQVVIPMAGLGSRFSEAGYLKPKPFIDVLGKTMIEQVMDNLRVGKSRFILIARREHLEAEPMVRRNIEAVGDVEFLPIDFLTEGAACTVLTARAALDPEAPLLIANCDQIIDFDCHAFIQDAIDRNLDGSILVFRDVSMNKKWSFARTNDRGHVVEVKEKEAISDLATVGLYYFRRARDFFDGCIDMISHRDRVNNEYYVCPVYNYLIKTGKTVGIFMVEPSAMHGLGTPSDLDSYLAAMNP